MIDIVVFSQNLIYQLPISRWIPEILSFLEIKTFYKYENICKHVISYTCDFNVPIPKIDSFIWRDSENIVYKVVHELQPYL